MSKIHKIFHTLHFQIFDSVKNSNNYTSKKIRLRKIGDELTGLFRSRGLNRIYDRTPFCFSLSPADRTCRKFDGTVYVMTAAR